MSRWREDPATVRPMLASLDEPPIAQRGLLYEPKYDGIRALVDVRPPSGRTRSAHVAIYSRNGNDKTQQFPAVVSAFSSLASSLEAPILVDAEIVAIDERDRPLGFQHVQGRIHLTSPADIARADVDTPVACIAFDLLRDGDEDLRGLPLAARRLRLQQRVRVPPRARRILRLSELAADDGRALYERAKKEGWEGLIAKDGSSPYHSGRRTPAWRKLKILAEQEFVIGGWTEPRMTRQHFGALLVGYYENGALRWAGNVGTGFNERELERVGTLLRARESARKPFADTFKTFEKSHWVKPELVAQVRFTEWTHEGLLRQPVYLGLRDDKKAKDVRREVKVDRGREVQGDKGREVRGDKGREVRGDKGREVLGKKSREVQGKKDREVQGEKDREVRSEAPLKRVLDRLSEFEHARKDGEVELPNGDRLRVTNLAKVFWPALGITKGELMRYYVQVSPMLLPVIDDRPLVMKRFPNGIERQAFYQQRHPEAVPPGVRREVLPEDVEPIDEEGPRDRLIGGGLTTLVYMTQLAAISQDPWFSRVASPMDHDHAAIDLDPGEGAGFDRVLDVARWVKDEMDTLGIPGVPKTSGSRGIHIYIPLPQRTSYETGQLLCQVVATVVSTKHPRVATVERMVKKRPRGTVYVDYLQNILGKTLATAYSARASDYAGVSTPLTWKEIEDGLDPRDFTIRTAPARFAEVGNLWKPLRTGKTADIRRILSRIKRP